ncbi:MAG TPA: non-ribosomal peptide synthetase [Candidatus Dormibacteraeota bacterium]|nr:non-ribosomal peptide synthetase [Candidatus Dormibacteraeota bacterium]
MAASAEPDTCIHELIERRSADRPDAVAVAAGGTRLAYGELDRVADGVARRLLALGTADEEVVGVCLERGPDLVVAALGILKAGAAYLPLDPRVPERRLRAMLADCRARFVFTSPGLAERVERAGARPLVFGERLGDPAGPAAAHGRDRPVHPAGLAYVIYTSGSTGAPKGVMIEHRAFVAHWAAATRLYDLRPADRVVQLASPAFDIALDQILSTLLAGATIVFPAGADPWPDDLPDQLAEHRVTMLEITPAHSRELLADLARPDPRLAALRIVDVGADVVTGADARTWAEAAPQCRFVATYGPTETAVTACAFEPDVEGSPASGPLPLGRPLAGTSARVLGRDLGPVAAGSAGELCIGGGRLGRGYLGQPGRTAERFVPDPLGPAGARIYRTGDRARLLPDGNLEFLGRLDQQVKVRGVRVEPGEIEAALAAHPEVREAVVLALPDGRGDRRLVGYVAGHSRGQPATAQLRSFLRERLPEAMVPSAFVVLERLPLTAGGKVDRGALAARGTSGVEAGEAAPETPLEARVAALWAEVLELPMVGIDDNFFDLGGHSLLLARVRRRLVADLEREVATTALYRYPTVRSLAAHLVGAAEEAPSAPDDGAGRRRGRERLARLRALRGQDGDGG